MIANSYKTNPSLHKCAKLSFEMHEIAEVTSVSGDDDMNNNFIDENYLFSTLIDILSAIDANDLSNISIKVNELWSLVFDKPEIYILKILDFCEKSERNFIVVIANCLTSPPSEFTTCFLRIFVAFLSIKSVQMTKYILQNKEFVNFLNTVLFQSNDINFLEYILLMISSMAADFAIFELPRFFEKVFPSFNCERILFIQNNFCSDLSFLENLLITVKCIADSQQYGDFYRQLIKLLINNFSPNFPPNILFSPLLKYVKKHPIFAIEDMIESNFLYGDLFNLYFFPHTKELPINRISYTVNSMKLTKACIKKKPEIANQLLDCLAVDDLCEFLFKDILSCKMNERGQNMVIKLTLKILFLDANRVGKDWIIIYLCSNHYDECICNFFTNGDFQIKSVSLQIIDLMVKASPLLDGEENFYFMNADFINAVVDFIADPTQEEEQIKLVLSFLCSLYTKSINVNKQILINYIANDYVVNSLSQYANHENSDLRNLAHELLNKIYNNSNAEE